MVDFSHGNRYHGQRDMTPAPPEREAAFARCRELINTLPDEELEPYLTGSSLRHVAEFIRNSLHEILDTGDANYKHEYDYSVFYYARQCLPLLRALLAAGADPATCAKEEGSFLLSSHVPLANMALMLKAGLTPNLCEDDEESPLIYACMDNAAERVRLLLAYGADAQSPWINENTPLFYAKSAEVAELLVNAGADINTRNREGKTPLMVAEERGKEGEEVAEWLRAVSLRDGVAEERTSSDSHGSHP